MSLPLLGPIGLSQSRQIRISSKCALKEIALQCIYYENIRHKNIDNQELLIISGPSLENNESLQRCLPTPGGHRSRQPASLRSRGCRHLREERDPLRGPPRQGREGRVGPRLGCDDRLLAGKRLGFFSLLYPYLIMEFRRSSPPDC